jgi:hypothetical protein
MEHGQRRECHRYAAHAFRIVLLSPQFSPLKSG